MDNTSDQDPITSRFKKYYAIDDFRNRHLEKSREKIKCVCLMDISRSNFSKHLKTKKHNAYVNNNLKTQEA